MYKLVLPVLLVGALTACGNNNNNGGGDGGNGGDGGSGSNIDAPLPACDYTETADATNNATSELTNVAIGAVTRTFCGNVDANHYDNASKIVDVDSYTVSVAGTSELIVQFSNDTPGNLTDFQVDIFGATAAPTLLSAGDYDGSLSDHGAYIAELPAGNYNIVVTATAAAGISAAIPYRVRVVADQPTTRCPDLTGMAADYTEANDGATNNGNDVILVDTTKDPSFTLTTSTADAPEASGLTVDPNKNFHISGSSASVGPGTDKYLDRDTYAVATGASTNELSIRLNWPGTTADLDYIVFEQNALTTPNVAAMLTATSEDEFTTFAVKPGTTYWVWVGAYKGSTGMPIAYSASVCGGKFTP